jgi:hypothetical protein
LHIFGRNGEQWSTYDGGDTFSYARLGLTIDDVLANPTAPNLFLMLAGGRLYLSQNSGASFVRVANALSSVSTFAWGMRMLAKWVE